MKADLEELLREWEQQVSTIRPEFAVVPVTPSALELREPTKQLQELPSVQYLANHTLLPDSQPSIDGEWIRTNLLYAFCEGAMLRIDEDVRFHRDDSRRDLQSDTPFLTKPAVTNHPRFLRAVSPTVRQVIFTDHFHLAITHHELEKMLAKGQLSEIVDMDKSLQNCQGEMLRGVG